MLQHLDLECNKVGNAGAAAIAGALPFNRVLRVLNLSSNHNNSHRATQFTLPILKEGASSNIHACITLH